MNFVGPRRESSRRKSGTGAVGHRLAPRCDAASHRRAGLSILEVVLCLLLVAMIAVPLFDLLVTSRKMGASGRDRLLAMSLAGSALSGLAAVPRDQLVEIERTADTALPPVLALSRLGVAAPSAGYRRSLSLVRLDLEGEDAGLWQATVTVEWESRVSGQPLAYTLLRLL